VRWLLLTLALVGSALLVVFIIGALLPRDHVASTSALIPAPPEDVFRAITDVEHFPSWRAVSKVDTLGSVDGHRRWREVSRFGPITFEQVEADMPHHFVSRVVDTDQGFGGTWTWDIAPSGNGSTVKITEQGYVSNPLFRFMSRYVFGHHATQEEYLRALGRKFGSDVTPTRG
jgi:uncharacterized protein YndB with AHSA1/START domain